jgi:hypothetical protein
LGGKQPPKKSAEGSEAEEDKVKSPLDYAEIFASLSFWYHLPYSDIRRMPHSAIALYMDKLAKQHAILRLMMGEAASVPHMDDDGRRERANEIEEKLNDGKRQIRPAPLAVLKMVGIGVRK